MKAILSLEKPKMYPIVHNTNTYMIWPACTDKNRKVKLLNLCITARTTNDFFRIGMYFEFEQQRTLLSSFSTKLIIAY